MLPNLIGALRAVIEMLGLCLLGQAVLHVLAGASRRRNGVYLLLDLLTKPPRQAVGWLLRLPLENRATGIVCFVLLFILWIGLALLRKFL
jgi:hypothetical protein